MSFHSFGVSCFSYLDSTLASFLASRPSPDLMPSFAAAFFSLLFNLFKSFLLSFCSPWSASAFFSFASAAAAACFSVTLPPATYF